jgi:hypothetical protein
VDIVSLWDKYKGQAVSMDTIFEDDFLPMVKTNFEKGLAPQAAIESAMMEIGTQMSGVCGPPPLDWMSRAREEMGLT